MAPAQVAGAFIEPRAVGVDLGQRLLPQLVVLLHPAPEVLVLVGGARRLGLRRHVAAAGLPALARLALALRQQLALGAGALTVELGGARHSRELSRSQKPDARQQQHHDDPHREAGEEGDGRPPSEAGDEQPEDDEEGEQQQAGEEQ